MTTAFTQTTQGQAFLALNEKQQAFVKFVIMSTIRQRSQGYVCAHDLADAVRLELWRNVPSFDWRNVTDHVQAGCWALEAEGQITRQMEGRHTTLRIA